MAHSPPETVVSGVPDKVIEVQGRAPCDIEKFEGPTTFILEGKTGHHTVTGEGAPWPDAVRFHEKDAGGEGRDLRVWRVYRLTDMGLVAESLAERV
ncbi:hypothetical protein [Georgenia sp. SYP-B2076]|uniref:hypothetical protein n=1 Tax=Georgenia sp. SYP-B2076 TaxID=2495881 RepID=UPI0013DEC43D|nr:hypothetical protein [Georgenia sp. SYP-B2076]